MNIPIPIARALDIRKGEVVEWKIVDRCQPLLVRKPQRSPIKPPKKRYRGFSAESPWQVSACQSGRAAAAKPSADTGGVVVGYGLLPSKSATLGRGSKDNAALREAIWGNPVKGGVTVCKTTAAGGRSDFLPQKPTPVRWKR